MSVTCFCKQFCGMSLKRSRAVHHRMLYFNVPALYSITCISNFSAPFTCGRFLSVFFLSVDPRVCDSFLEFKWLDLQTDMFVHHSFSDFVYCYFRGHPSSCFSTCTNHLCNLYEYFVLIFKIKSIHWCFNCWSSCVLFVTYHTPNTRLGVTLTSDGTWDHHISNVISKASKILGLLRCSIKISSSKVKSQAYLCYVHPLLQYDCSIWDPHTAKNISSLKAVQRRAVRWVTYNYHQTSSVDAIKSDQESRALPLSYSPHISEWTASTYQHQHHSVAAHTSVIQLLRILFPSQYRLQKIFPFPTDHLWLEQPSHWKWTLMYKEYALYFKDNHVIWKKTNYFL